MADFVEQVLQDMVPELDDLRRKRIFTEDELRQIVRRRRDFEYSLQRKPGKPQDYLNYVRYEIAMETLRLRRSKERRWRKRSLSDHAGIRRVHSILTRGTRKFKGDLRMWYQHLDFCLRSGSTQVLTQVLMRAVKYHPREVPLWLLAADRELRQGHIEAARKLLLRALRCVPGCAKVLVEYMRLEVGVATTQLAMETEEGPTEAKDVWAPTKLLFQKGLAKISGLEATAAFLSGSLELLQQAAVKWSETKGFQDWSSALLEAAKQLRPVEAVPSEVEAAIRIWEVSWTMELAGGASWGAMATEVANCQLPAVLAAAARAARGDAAALETLAAAESTATEAESALAVLQELSVAKLSEASEALLRRAVAKHPRHPRLALVSGSHDEVPQSSSALDAACWLLETRPMHAGKPCGKEVEELFRSIQRQELAPALSALVGDVVAREGAPGFARACREVRKMAENLWDVPGLRHALLLGLLELQLRAIHLCEVKQIAQAFEQLLASQPDDVDLWLRYLGFAQEAGVAMANLNLRALRSVKDQAVFREKAQLQGLDL